MPTGRDALRADARAIEALHALADHCSGLAFSQEASECAQGCLKALSDQSDGSDGSHASRQYPLHWSDPMRDIYNYKHIMVSYQWDVQQTIKRIVGSLSGRGYHVWTPLSVQYSHPY